MKEEISLKELVQALLRGKGTIIKITLIVVLISAVYSLIIVKPYYTVSSVMYIDFQAYEYSKEYMQLYEDFVLETNLDLETFRGNLKKHSQLEEVIEDLNLDRRKYTPRSISQAIDMNRLDDERLFGITMKGSDPEAAAAIVNTLSDKFVDSLKDWQANLVFAVANKELLKQKETAEAMINETIDKLNEFMEDTPTVPELEIILPNHLNKLAALQSQLIDAQIRLRKDQEEIKYLESQERTSNVVESLLSANQRRATSEGEVAMVEEAIIQLEKDVRELQLEKSKKRVIYDGLHSEMEARKKALHEITDKYNASYISEFNNAGNLAISVIAPAYVPSQPDGPNVRLNLIMGLAAGLLVGSAAALFKEYWNKEPDDIDNSSAAD